MKRAAIIKFEDRYVIHSDSTTVDGYGIASDPYITISVISTMDIVKSLLFAMNASKTNVIDLNSSSFLKDYLKLIGLRTHKELYKNSICCQVYDKDNKTTFLPSVNMGISGGFKHCPEKKVEISSDASTEETCSALVESLSRCE